MEHVQPNVFDPNCGSRRVLNLIAARWTALVIYALDGETRRYSELEKMIGGISQKMLTQTLRNLEHDGIVARTVYPVVPPHVEYALTPLGATLIEALRSLCLWAQENLDAVEAARQLHEQQARREGGSLSR
jgi:DNA-binding HxlR family transcriptional regulator